MTTKELASYIGKPALLTVERLKVLVTVKDCKQAFGRLDLLVCPVGGEGLQWVSAERLTFDK